MASKTSILGSTYRTPNKYEINQNLKTTQKTQFGFTSPLRSKQSPQIEQIKNSITGIINDVARKKNDNRGAIEEVINTNIDVIESLDHPPITSFENIRSEEWNVPNVAMASSFAYKSPVRNLNSPTPNRQLESNQSRAYTTEQLIDQNTRLRQRLNEQIAKNNDLIRRNYFLQNQNQQLKNQLSFTAQPGRSYTGKNLGDTRYQ